MKARELQKLLETDRTIHFVNGCICIASLYCHNLISLDVNNFKVNYALSPRSSDDEIRKLTNGLQSLTQSEIEYYSSGADEIDNPITLFYCTDDGDIKTAITDSLDFPSVTDDGVLIYSNTHFKTIKEMLIYEIQNIESAIKFANEHLIERREELNNTQLRLDSYNAKLAKLSQAVSEVQSE